ncbi:hypothetical protein LAV72_18210 [Lysinibacillus xylanilyticus]|uniref:hypothetical protein n=1 Tax=Lysinibacillus xylanilyticus TaxID=582475 RepID=UPI002B24780C|nr:hypothetical protein [Lysinibacillus xylanilyticus]MEB2301542.1 hypothetical protein [Lysinibacillus xylanilyticus]
MNAARLQDVTIIAAKDYSPAEHGLNICCMDIACQVPVHFVQENKKVPCLGLAVTCVINARNSWR